MVPAILYDSPGTLERGTQGHFRGKSTTRKGASPRVRTPIGWMARWKNAKVPDCLERELQLGTTSVLAHDLQVGTPLVGNFVRSCAQLYG